MYDAQIDAVAAAATAARARSAAATPALLAHLNSSSFRESLHACCAASGLAAQPAEQLLSTLRAIIYAGELVHNFDGSWEQDATIEIGLRNATDYFPSTWQLRYLEYYGPRNNPRWGFPSSPEGVSEEAIYYLPRFQGPHDEPTSFESASSRLLYIALNALRADVGNPGFGNVTAIFSPSFWQDAIVAAPADSGLFTMFCNESYRHTPGAHKPPPLPTSISCDGGGDTTAGVLGHMDHVILNNGIFWKQVQPLTRYFARSYGDSNVSTDELVAYIEPNILANARYADQGRALKLLVGSFAPLFGTARGALLQQWGAARGVPLAWGIGTGKASVWDTHEPVAFAGTTRMLDLHTSASLVNASTTPADAKAFTEWWDAVAAARDPQTGELPPSQVWALWARGGKVLPPAAQLALPRAGDCADWDACLGRSRGGACVCAKGEVEAI